MDTISFRLNTHRDLLLLVSLDNRSKKHGLQYAYR
jgi:hypothetical protein